MTDADSFLEDVTAIIEEKHRVLLSLEEVEIAIELQTKKVADLTTRKQKQTVYAMVLLDCLRFLKAGKVEVLDGVDEMTTEGQLKVQVSKVAAGIYNGYIENLPLDYLVSIQEASTGQVLLMQKALEGEQDAMMELALLMKSRGNTDAYNYWLKQISEEVVDLTIDHHVNSETLIASTVQVPSTEPAIAQNLTEVGPDFAVNSGNDVPVSESSPPTVETAKLDNLTTEVTETAFQPLINNLHPWVVEFLSFKDGVLRQKHAINLVKLSALPVCAALSVLYAKYDNTFLVYSALHVTYSVSWFVTTSAFPLNTLERSLSVAEAYESLLSLYSFFLPTVLICSYNVQLSNTFLMLMVITCFTGNFIVTGSIIQKSCTPNQLMTTGFFKYVRHPTVFGEILVYTSLALMSCTFLGLLPLLSFVLFVWAPSMRFKEEGLAAKFSSEWLSYRKSSKRVIPFFY